ncbi:MAG TPA: thioredoxin family protein [Bacteroidales bacterium]|nr:thioredoxin family protein [Bacteroidales bacterium]
MERKLVLFLLFFITVTGCRTSRVTTTADVPPPPPPPPITAVPVIDEAAEHVWDFRDATTWILGDMNPDKLLESPHSTWYLKGYDEYLPDAAVMDELKSISKDGLTVTVVFGTWCPDSRREVPRFMKMTELWGFPATAIRFIGVDINKIAPLGDYPLLGIERVPTFIFYRNNVEAGRIIEVPVTSLEQDTRDILRK